MLFNPMDELYVGIRMVIELFQKTRKYFLSFLILLFLMIIDSPTGIISLVL